ncbi:MAG: endonuclease/exonuclease/phosphatase family protein [Gemmatimonadales bacterium]|nr:endonuclease/exonuclease/phosphatase family protein [Gemmatimonadales bacterium]
MGHRVRLAPGRFWQSAKCRACGAAVDSIRIRRIGRWLSTLRLPASARNRDRALWLSAAGYLALALFSAALLWLLADRWWAATTLLFGPRWLLLLPAVALAVPAIKWDRPLLVPIAGTVLIVLGPVMGLRTGWQAWLTGGDTARDVRIVSLNAEGGRPLTMALTDMLLRWRADVLAIQECGPRIEEAFQFLEEWHTDATGSLCVVSRYPITRVDAMPREGFEVAGGAAMVVTYRLEAQPVPIHLTNIHLETPRAGLEKIRAGDLAGGIPTLEGKSTLREIEQSRAARWIEQFPHPQIVAGDFNSPPESPIYRHAWAEWTNTFSVAGRGFGYTRMNGWIQARIDHILVDDTWKVVRAWVGPDVGSDHKPMLATIRLRRGSELR